MSPETLDKVSGERPGSCPQSLRGQQPEDSWAERQYILGPVDIGSVPEDSCTQGQAHIPTMTVKSVTFLLV